MWARRANVLRELLSMFIHTLMGVELALLAVSLSDTG
jgi:hypothetical protein